MKLPNLQVVLLLHQIFVIFLITSILISGKFKVIKTTPISAHFLDRKNYQRIQKINLKKSSKKYLIFHQTV
jgi:hypothetical protein